jgi:hypothetical protein
MRKSKIMKALLVFGMSAVTATSMVGIVACDTGTEGENPTHQHSWGAWQADGATGHKRECTAEGHEGDKWESAQHGAANSEGKCPDCGFVLETPHNHNWATEWTNSDANKHYYACLTEGHTGAQKDEAPHADANNDNTCDVCGYAGGALAAKFTELAASENKILASTFLDGTKLPTFGNWGTAGIYQGYGTDGAETTHYVEIKDGKAVINTPAAAPATYLYADLGAVNGLVEGYFEVSDFLNGTTGYTPIQFVGEGGVKEEVFGLRANGTWQYRVDGGSNVTPDTMIECEGSKIYFSYDSSTNLLNVKIGDSVLVSDLKLNCSSLKGIKFSSGDSNAKSYSVDNLVVTNTPPSADEYRTVITNKVTAAEALLPTALQNSQAKTDADTAITAATTIAELDAAYNTYYNAVLSSYRTHVIDATNNKYPASNYTREENKATYEAAMANGTAAVTGADKLEDITKAATAWDGAIAEIRNDDYYNQATFDVTVSDGTTSQTISGKRSGDKITKAELDAKLTVEDGKTITGYTINGTQVYFGDEGYTLSEAVTFVAIIENKVVNAKESWSTAAGSADSVSSQTFEASDLITENTLFKVNATTGLLYSVGKAYGQINTGSNAASYTNLAGESVSPDQGIKLVSAINAGASVDSAFTITAKEKCTVTFYATWCNDSYNSNKSGRITYSVNGGEVTETADLTARKNISVISVDLNAGDVLTVGGKNTHGTDTGKLWLFGAEAVLKN